MKKNKIFLISSSTGGHALPILHIYRNLKNDFKVKIFHSGSALEREIFKDCIKTRVFAGKIRRYRTVANIFQVLLTAFGFVQVLLIMLFDRPKAIFSKGGFCAVPVLTAAKLLNIPYYAHESDSVMGVSNKIFAKSAKTMFVGFPTNLYEKLHLANLVYSGQIVNVEKQGKKTERSTIYITGGSQGAVSINKIVFAIAPKLLNNFHIIHQVGDFDKNQANDFYESLSGMQKKFYEYFSFSIEKSRASLAQSDLVVARAGANTIGEIAALSKASILIPYKYAAGDHQSLNAKYLEKNGGAIVIKEDNFDERSLEERIQYVLSNKMNSEIIGKKANETIKTDGLSVICETIRKEVQ